MSGSKSCEETEGTINQYLQEHGLLEEGMTLDDKRSLWEVIKLSRDTAQAEEKDRQKRARQNLQFDEVSSRSDDGPSEDAKVPVVAVIPQVRDSPHQNTAIIPPLHYLPSSTTVSPSQQSLSVDSYTRDLPKQPVGPSPRRSFRLKPADVEQISSIAERQSSILDQQSTSSPKNLKIILSPKNVYTMPSHEQVEDSSGNSSVQSPGNNCSVKSPTNIQTTNSEKKEECHSISQSERREASPLSWSKVVAGSSKSNLPSTPPSVELTHDESPACSDGESSPVRKLRQGFNLSLKFSPSSKSDVECRALNEKERSETVPSPVEEPPVNKSASPEIERTIVNDRKRNIDAFNCDRSNYNLTLKFRKPRKMSGLPFYIPPRKMDVHSYINYFKKCVNDHSVKLLEVQKRFHKCVPWGDPVVVGEINSKSYTNSEQKKNPTASQRDRRLTPVKVDTIYEDPSSENETKTEEQANDALFDSLLDDKSSDGIQIIKSEDTTENPKSNSATPERQGSKRKSESSDEMEEKRSAAGTWLTTVKTKEEEVAVKRKKLGTVCYAGAANSWKDLDLDIPSEDESSNNGPSQQVQRKRGRKKLAKLPSKKTETVDVDDADMFDDVTTVEGTSSATKSTEVDVIKPAPVKLRRNCRRRLLQSAQPEQTEADVTVVYEAPNSGNSVKEQEMEVPCPICRVSYPAKDIEAHASECNEYCSEDIPENEEQSSSPPASSQDCWSQYDGVHGGSTQDNLQNILEGRMSPIRCFVPISAQHDSEIDYHNQFRIAKTLRRPTVTKGRRKKRRVKRKRKRSDVAANKKRKIVTGSNYFAKKVKNL